MIPVKKKSCDYLAPIRVIFCLREKVESAKVAVGKVKRGLRGCKVLSLSNLGGSSNCIQREKPPNTNNHV